MHSFSKNFRAVARSISCSWLNPKSMDQTFRRLASDGGAPAPRRPAARSSVLRQSEDAFGDDVLLDLRRAALDRVGAGPEERVLPEPALDGPLGAAHELRVWPLDLHGELLEPLVRVHPAHLAGGGLGTGDLSA